AQSGAGKTSLLNAQIIPLLEKRGSEVYGAVRVGGELPKGVTLANVDNVYTYNALMTLEAQTHDPGHLQGLTLQRYLKARPRPELTPGIAPLRVVVFDQFEEIFSSFP